MAGRKARRAAGRASRPVVVAPVVTGSPVTVNLASVVRTTTPESVGVCSTTYGATPLDSVAQANAEKALDARYVRIPIGWRNNRVTTSAGGGNTNLDVPALVAIYQSWGYKCLLVCGGRTNDYDIQAGDATKFFQGLGFDGITYTSTNEPGNQGKTITDQVAAARMILAEGKALAGAFTIGGPVWAWYQSSALRTFVDSIGGDLAALDYHNYGMGTPPALSTAQAMLETPNQGTQVAAEKAYLVSAGRGSVPVLVDELNFTWQYVDGTTSVNGGDGAGGNRRLFTAIDTVWIASCLGHILINGGQGMPFGTQNGPLGVMVQPGQAVNPDGRPVASPMPAYWGIAAWTGAAMPNGANTPKAFPHFNNAMYSVSSMPNLFVEVFAVNNEGGGFNLVIINKSESTSYSLALTINGTTSGGYAVSRNDPVHPYDQPLVTDTGLYTAGVPVGVTLPPMTVSVMVLTSGGGGGSRTGVGSGGVRWVGAGVGVAPGGTGSTLTGTLVDTFSGDLSLWPAQQGGSIVAGRGRVATGLGYNSLATAAVYSIAGSQLSARVWPPAAGGATVATAAVEVESATGGTTLMMEINVVAGTLTLQSRAGYADANAVTITYDPAAHAYLRLREAAGSVFWETSPNRGTWTIRRTAATPVWVAASTARVRLSTHRDAGVVDYAEFDDVNL